MWLLFWALRDRGETTLLRSINFLEPADSGTIELDGETIEIAKATKQDIQGIRKHTGFVFQNYNLFANKTAEQNITEGVDLWSWVIQKCG
jgi:L-cystine transport system ATP-binding protein